MGQTLSSLEKIKNEIHLADGWMKNIQVVLPWQLPVCRYKQERAHEIQRWITWITWFGTNDLNLCCFVFSLNLAPPEGRKYNLMYRQGT